MSSLPCKLAVRFVGSVKDDDITRWSTIQVRERCQGAPLKNESPWWSTPARVTGVQSVCTCTRLCISSFSVTGEREKEAFVVFTERRWKAIPANENKRVRPATRRTNWRACYGWEFKEGWIGGWIGGDEGARSKAAQHEGGSASQASMFHPWSIRKLALLSSFYRA